MGDAGGAHGAGQGDVDAGDGVGARCGRGGGLLRRLQSGFDLLLQLVEAHAERLARLGGRGLQPGLADQLEAALLATEPVQAEGLDVLDGRDVGVYFGTQVREGALQRRLIKIFQVNHASSRVNDRPRKPNRSRDRPPILNALYRGMVQ